MSDLLQAASDLELLRHALGVTEQRPLGYERNHFVAGADDVPAWERLVAVGFAVKNQRYSLSSDPCYHVTPAGARAIGQKFRRS